MSWRERLDELRREAVSKLHVWREEESLLKRSVPTGDGHRSVSISPEEGDVILRTQAIAVINGWHLVLSLAVFEQKLIWHFSGMLFPRGRSSVEKDWKWIGTMVGYLGGPNEPIFWPDDPNAPVHWNWPADDTDRDTLTRSMPTNENEHEDDRDNANSK